MKRGFATEGWWVGTLSLLIISNVVLAFWAISETLGLRDGAGLGDFLYYFTFFGGMFVAPLAAVLGVLTALGFLRTGLWTRSAILSFLSGGAGLCAWIAWSAFLSGGR